MTRGRWQWIGFGAALLAAGVGAAWAQPAPNNCGLNMLCRVRTLIVSGDTTMTGDLSVDDLTVTDDMSADDGTFATVTFSGGGTPCLTRGGNTDVQSCEGDGFVSKGRLQTQTHADLWGDVRQTSNGGNCTNTAAACFNDPDGFEWTNGSGVTVGVGSVTGLISGDTGISSGAWSAMWWTGAAIPEGSDGMGGYRPTTVGRGSKFRQVACSCRVAGSGGTTGIVLSLMEDGVEVDTQEINSAADTNACDDAAGALLTGDFNYTIVADRLYELQVKATTDCAGNPTDCLCGTDVTR